MVEYTRGGVTAVGIKNFTINEYFFPGHFPGKPIVPGVILIEVIFFPYPLSDSLTVNHPTPSPTHQLGHWESSS